MSKAAMSVPVRLLHEGLGTLLIGTWLNTALFALELTQVYRYFTQHPLFASRVTKRASITKDGRRPDRLWIQVLVLSMLTLDIVATFSACALAYGYTVTGWGNIRMLQINTLPLSLYCVSTVLSMLIMHLFLIFRYYRLSRYTVVSIFLALLALSACALAMKVSIIGFTVTRKVADRAKLRTQVIYATTANTSTDWMVAGALMLLLIRIRTTVDDAQGLLIRLIRNSFLSGFGPGCLSLICLIGFLCSPSTNFSLMFGFCFGRGATLTVLYNLNLRSSLANSSNNASKTGTNIYIDTAVEPCQLFRKSVGHCSPDETTDQRPAHLSKTLERETAAPRTTKNWAS